jgi:hypothetical protein
LEDGKGTFSRGNRVSMLGRLKSTPFGVDAIGHVLRSWLSRAWAPSRAVAARSASRVVGVRRGFGSQARRSPRSKV